MLSNIYLIYSWFLTLFNASQSCCTDVNEMFFFYFGTLIESGRLAKLEPAIYITQ